MFGRVDADLVGPGVGCWSISIMLDSYSHTTAGMQAAAAVKVPKQQNRAPMTSGFSVSEGGLEQTSPKAPPASSCGSQRP